MTITDLGVSFKYITGGVTYNLNGSNTISTPIGGQYTFSYLGDQGFGLAPLHRITTRGPLQHGDSDIDFRLDPRILQIPLVVKNESSTAPKATHYSIRNALLQIFKPQSSGTLQILIGTTSGGVSKIQDYRIDTKVLGGLSFDVEPTSYHVRTIVQLRAEDPTWYEPYTSGNPYVVTYFDTNIGSSQIFPIGGNWQTYPVIRINGPITNPTITNTTTGEVIAITATISAGAYYDIDLSYGAKTVVDNTGTNRISTVSAASDLATWHFEPGNNTIAVTGSSTSSSSDIDFTYYNRYTGI